MLQNARVVKQKPVVRVKLLDSCDTLHRTEVNYNSYFKYLIRIHGVVVKLYCRLNVSFPKGVKTSNVVKISGILKRGKD